MEEGSRCEPAPAAGVEVGGERETEKVRKELWQPVGLAGEDAAGDLETDAADQHRLQKARMDGVLGICASGTAQESAVALYPALVANNGRLVPPAKLDSEQAG